MPKYKRTITKTISSEDIDTIFDIEIDLYDPIDVKYDINKIELIYDERNALQLKNQYKTIPDFSKHIDNIIEAYIEKEKPDIIYDLRNDDTDLI